MTRIPPIVHQNVERNILVELLESMALTSAPTTLEWSRVQLKVIQLREAVLGMGDDGADHRIAELEVALVEMRNLFDPYGRGRLNECQEDCAIACARADRALGWNE
jgi:hypothetical protein